MCRHDREDISQGVWGCPHSARTVPLQARHGYYSNTEPFTVRVPRCTCLGVMSDFSARGSWLWPDSDGWRCLPGLGFCGAAPGFGAGWAFVPGLRRRGGGGLSCHQDARRAARWRAWRGWCPLTGVRLSGGRPARVKGAPSSRRLRRWRSAPPLTRSGRVSPGPCVACRFRGRRGRGLRGVSPGSGRCWPGLGALGALPARRARGAAGGCPGAPGRAGSVKSLLI